MIIPLDKSHKVITNKVFSSLTCVIPDFKKRYETQIKTSDECFKKIMQGKSEKAKAKYLRRLRKKENIVETSVEQLCVKENIRFKVARAESWNAIVLLDSNRTIYQNEQFSVGRQNVYIIGLKGLKTDNLNIRIIMVIVTKHENPLMQNHYFITHIQNHIFMNEYNKIQPVYYYTN